MKQAQYNNESLDIIIETSKNINRISQRAKLHKYRNRKSALDVHTGVIMAMHNRGCSLSVIQTALRAVCKPSVVRDVSTIHRFIKKNVNDLQKL